MHGRCRNNVLFIGHCFRFAVTVPSTCNSLSILRKSSALRDKGREASVIVRSVLWNTGLYGACLLASNEDFSTGETDKRSGMGRFQ